MFYGPPITRSWGIIVSNANFWTSYLADQLKASGICFFQEVLKLILICIKTILYLYRCFHHLYISITYLQILFCETRWWYRESFEECSYLEGLLWTCLWVCNIHMLLIKMHFESSVADWGFVDIWFVLVSKHVKRKKGKR